MGESFVRNHEVATRLWIKFYIKKFLITTKIYINGYRYRIFFILF
jgi:hypothetical protein